MGNHYTNMRNQKKKKEKNEMEKPPQTCCSFIIPIH